MQIRSYRSDDEQAVIDLWFRCDLVVPWNNPRLDIQRKLQVDPELLLVGLEGNTLVATVMGGYEGHRGWINYLAVDPRRRRCGYGRLMMDEIESRLAARGCPKINLQVRANNRDVVAFYEAIGYKVEELVDMGKFLSHDPPYEQS
ncbi:GNAT family acetyltransferase [bacterium]|nr:GNAT family acetyltransferase [bacterium]